MSRDNLTWPVSPDSQSMRGNLRCYPLVNEFCDRSKRAIHLTNIGFGIYFVFAACLTLGVPFVYFFVPETKGLSLEYMDALFGVPGADRHLFPRIDDAEKGSIAIEHKEWRLALG